MKKILSLQKLASKKGGHGGGGGGGEPQSNASLLLPCSNSTVSLLAC
jgi:hypothetical protein